MSKKEEEYLTLEDIEDEMADFLTIELDSRKSVIMKRISKDEESKIRRKHTKFVYDNKMRQNIQQIDTEKYNDEIMVSALVKPKLTLTQIRKMSTVMYNEIFAKYSQQIGLLALSRNLEDTLTVI